MVCLGLLIPERQKWLWLELSLLMLLTSVTVAHSSPDSMVLRRSRAVNRRKSHTYHEILLGCPNVKNCCSGWLRLKQPIHMQSMSWPSISCIVLRANSQKCPLGCRPTGHAICPPLQGLPLRRTRPEHSCVTAQIIARYINSMSALGCLRSCTFYHWLLVGALNMLPTIW